jgi:hypothetical protein
MTDAQERIIRIARKLFALAAKAGTQEEAESAAMKARALLSEYSLQISEVELRQIETDMHCLEKEQRLTTTYVPSWVKTLFQGILQGFVVKGFFTADRYSSKMTVTFAGVEPDVSLASFTFDYLYRVGKACRGLKTKKEKQRNQWRMGFATALLHRFFRYQRHEQVHQERTLAPVKMNLVEQHMAVAYPDLKLMRPPGKVRETKAFCSGFEVGTSVKWGTPVGGESKRPEMLTA